MLAGTEESAPHLVTLLSRVPEILYRFELGTREMAKISLQQASEVQTGRVQRGCNVGQAAMYSAGTHVET